MILDGLLGLLRVKGNIGSLLNAIKKYVYFINRHYYNSAIYYIVNSLTDP